MSIHPVILAEAADEKNAVSFRTLQTQTTVSSAGAQAMFVDAKVPAVTLFCVGGILDSESLSRTKPREFCLVSRTDYASAAKRLSKRTTAHPFAIVPKVTQETPSLLYAEVAKLTKEHLGSESTSAQHFRRNRGSAIRCPEVKVLPPGATAASRPAAAPPATAKSSSSATSTGGKPSKNVKATSASSFFGKAAASASQAAKGTNKASSSTEEKSATAEKRKARVVESDEEAEWDGADTDEEPAVTSKPKAKKEPTSKAPQKASTTAVVETDAHESSVEKKDKKHSSSKIVKETKAESAAEAPESPHAKKKATKVVEEDEPDGEVAPGAMDSFVAATKKKKKKLVEKTFMDDKGYLVTENVWEEVTDDEADSKPQPTKRAKEDSKPPVESSAAKSKKSKSAPAGGPQRSMMSFFGKK